MIRGLRATVAFPHGTGKQAKKELDFPVMGKTGTATNQAGDTTDNWFIGCTPSFCMAVWIGREQKLPMTSYDANGKEIQETGGKNALPVFIKTMKAMYEAMPKEQFPEMTDPTQPFRPSEKKETEQKTENAEEGLEQNEGY
jgi:membrane carboxypeptidase/penicillin-binding protein